MFRGFAVLRDRHTIRYNFFFRVALPWEKKKEYLDKTVYVNHRIAVLIQECSQKHS